MTPLFLTQYTASCCLGAGLQPLSAALRSTGSGLAPCRFEDVELDTWIGAVAEIEDHPLPQAWGLFECRNNRLAYLGLGQDGFTEAVAACISRLGARRVGLFIGTSTSGILQTELAYRQRDPGSGALPAAFHYAGTHNTFSAAAFIRQLLGIQGPAAVVSTACSSSAKAFGAAQRMIGLGIIDAAVVGGVDSLCLTTLYGFHSLQLTARRPCRPFAADRDGISIGEAAAFVLLEKSAPRTGGHAIALLGVGESNDGYHLSAPHPEGLGARLAMESALSAAGLDAAEVGYINLHGTGTSSNDSAECTAVTRVFGAAPPCSSTKGATGHTLGAAGALEAVICALALRDQLLPGGSNTGQLDPALQLNYITKSEPGRITHAVSNSFGFGGTNCSLVLGRIA
ncbi:MAG TPA: beta-ketoacyl-[acyl-carrier-protein] synthase family protein [Steroidobacteraceae bacterium]|nr:beta-ketoacyl-[acyl-carrier-protein] synthase family protein [Steroidobacteraceae bacterium]